LRYPRRGATVFVEPETGRQKPDLSGIGRLDALDGHWSAVMPCTWTLTIIASVAWMWASSVDAAEVLRTTLAVRVYEATGLTDALEDRALAVATETLRGARVDVRWKRCSARKQRPAEPSCAQPLGGGAEREVAVRIVGGTAPAAATMPTPLGDAHVDTRGSPALATVYFNRVVWLATVAGTDLPVLLGRAIAHELGHLLMASTTHARAGLMRPTWTSAELRRGRVEDWTFGAADVAAIRARAAGVGTRAW
jgi:hypothetical protein